ncbi:hypothetical protein K503DRAFT_245342 [Rhizopogon vinicolor AM-OR11-026]|uniref:Uncharacterized protein n=1 Tax=Rhizopogon vinicolor AM-OR11-026 TaxID=1314800 RepID=A0A1B7MXG7_9AGAM|nr:hypothetical protein K503DRAFT_245342 [Rhizopogon vinicolor AM-OR11-026]
MSNHASSDQKNTRVDVQTDACSNSSGITMGNQASSEQQHTDTKMATSNLPTMSHTIHTYPLRGGAEDESEDEDDSDYDYSGSESEDESEGDSEDIGGDDEGEDVRSDGEAEDDCGTECEYEDEDGGAGNDSVITESAKNVADSEAPSVPAISGDNGLSRAKSVESSFSSSTTGTPPPCAPSQSQPFPLPSYDPITPLDPSIDLSLKGDFPPNAESESSPEPDFPSVKEMLAKTRPPPSQPANQKVQAFLRGD